MKIKTDDEINLFVRDEQTGRFQFNASALQSIGIDPILARQYGYSLKEPSCASGHPSSREEGYRHWPFAIVTFINQCPCYETIKPPIDCL